LSAKAKSAVVGRGNESAQIGSALDLQRNVLIEGPVGVGKTFLVQEILKGRKQGYERIDGDTRYTEQKLTGWFDPPLVLKKGYSKDTFLDGPLVTAMKEGRVLFINELNRMPEAVQNILLPAMDERRISLPKIGEITAKKGFCVVATQNPREFTATHSLSEALLDRFEMIRLDYQSEAEERNILDEQAGDGVDGATLGRALYLVRATRNHPAIKRGASIRAALAVCQLVGSGVDFRSAVFMALPGRIEMIASDHDARAVLAEILDKGAPASAAEKKTQKT
jgi:MoxR-like ATPase